MQLTSKIVNFNNLIYQRFVFRKPLNRYFTNSEDPDDNSSGSTQLVNVKKIFGQKNTNFFKNYNLAPLDMYNGLSKCYCIKPEERIH